MDTDMAIDDSQLAITWVIMDLTSYKWDFVGTCN